MTKILTGNILTPHGWIDGSIKFDEHIISIEGVKTFSPTAPYVIPGFVDLHVHGGQGFDMMSGSEAILGASKFHRKHGTTSMLATSVTAPKDETEIFLRAVQTSIDTHAQNGARILGAHLEGPFLNPEKLGAQPPFTQEPSNSLVDKWCTIAPVIVTTIAPEMDSGHEVIKYFQKKGVKVQIGHSLCDYCEARKTIEAGCGVTHLFNAMSGFSHRGNGIVGAAIAHSEYAEIIPDLIHVEEGAILAAIRAIPNLYGVTDSTAGAGMPDGEFVLGQHKVYKNGNVMTLKDGTLAGSVLTMDQALRNLVNIGINLREAVERLSTIPANWIERDDIGRLSHGAFSDILVLDKNLNIEETIVGGDRIKED